MAYILYGMSPLSCTTLERLRLNFFFFFLFYYGRLRWKVQKTTFDLDRPKKYYVTAPDLNPHLLYQLIGI